MFTVKKVIDDQEVKVKLETAIQVSAFLTEGFELAENVEAIEEPEKVVNKGGRPKKS